VVAGRRKSVRNLSLARIGKGFPKKMMITHKYNEVLTITSVAGGLASFSFAANGMYDTDITYTGHQPMYFDQMSALYDHYHVIGSKIKVKVTPAAENQMPVVFGCYKNDDSTVTPTTLNALMEQTEATHKVISLNAGAPAVFSKKWSAKKTFGGSILGNPSLQGTASANPTETTVYTFFMKPMDVTASNVACYITIEIEYIAVWAELKDIQSS